MGLDEAGSTDKGLFVLYALSAAFWGWVEEVGWRISETDRAASYTARFRSGQVAGVDAAPKGHGGGVDGFLEVAVGRDIVEKAVSRGEVVLGGVRLMGGKLADGSEDRKVNALA
jgi:hypothetical protein